MKNRSARTRVPVLGAPWRFRWLRRCATLSGCLAVAAVAAEVPDFADVQAQANGGLRELVERYTQDEGSLGRFYDLPISPATLERSEQFYQGWRDELAKLPFDTLDQPAQIDYVLLQNQIEFELRRIELSRQRTAETALLIPFGPAIVELHDNRQQRQGVVADEAAALLTKLINQIDGLQKGFGAQLKAKSGGSTASDAKSGVSVELPDVTEVRKTVANRAAQTVDQLRETLKEWFGYHNGYDPLFTWWTSEPYKQLDSKLEGYATFLRREVVGLEEGDTETIVGDPVGREVLLVDLRREMIPYTPEELIEIARKEFAWCDREMLRASRDMGYGDDWRKALEHVKTLHVPPGEQPALILEQAREAIEYVKEYGLVTVPPLAEETWRMRMMTPERQRINPFFTGGEVISISYPTDGMSHEQKLMSMRGNNIHFSRSTVHHELIPGHHLQQFMNRRYRPYRRAFRTPFWTEGWAFYWEMLLWDMEFPKTAENRVGMLFWRMHRCARIIFSLSFHLGKMTAAEAIDFLVDRVGHERANAVAEVRRSFASEDQSLYQCAYMLGALQFRALQRELVGSGKMTNKEFHDAVLRQNSMPVEMVRIALSGESPARDFAPSWRFYD
jgi:uncharacterized protein (DUF885 family)